MEMQIKGNAEQVIGLLDETKSVEQENAEYSISVNRATGTFRITIRSEFAYDAFSGVFDGRVIDDTSAPNQVIVSGLYRLPWGPKFFIGFWVAMWFGFASLCVFVAKAGPYERAVFALICMVFSSIGPLILLITHGTRLRNKRIAERVLADLLVETVAKSDH